MNLFAFGLGYSAQALIRSSGLRFSRIAGTVRNADKAARLNAAGIHAYALSEGDSPHDLAEEIARADAILISVPPGDDGDPTLKMFTHIIARSTPRWIGYLSTTGVYGDRDGAWTDEDATPHPISRHSQRRLVAEQEWLALGAQIGAPAQVFRLSGIYGPGRNALVDLARGTARRIIKPGHVFNRIHVDDIAAILAASIARPRQGGVYNAADDEPAAAADVVTYAAGLAKVEPPPEITFEDASFSAMGKSFYAESKKIANGRIKSELRVSLLYPTYREGLQALYAAGEFSHAA